MIAASTSFLLAFPALFSIVNPIGSAFIFNEVTSAYSHEARVRVSGRIGLYSACVMLGALWGGAYILNFFGISLGALRIAGGAVVTLRAWDLMAAPERQEERKQAQAAEDRAHLAEMAFFPLTMPFTAGPGTIAVAIALGADRPSSGVGLIEFFVGVSAAAVAVAVGVWLMYRFSDRMVSWMSVSARRSISRMSAFLLVCIGTQIVLTGVEEILTGYSFRAAAP